VVTVKNSGTGTAQAVQLTAAVLGSANGSAIPQTLGNIAPGGSTTAVVTFPASAGASGANVVERLSGTYTGGTFATTLRVKLP
jgi:hypothetical protein